MFSSVFEGFPELYRTGKREQDEIRPWAQAMKRYNTEYFNRGIVDGDTAGRHTIAANIDGITRPDRITRIRSDALG